jgi:CRISPR system Cascade subunit CasD
MARHLILILEGPLAAYGAEMVDARGPVRDWPGASLLSGLLANALGFS